MEEEAKKIAKQWGWDLEELLSHLDDGGTSTHWDNVSAAQAAYEIIIFLLGHKE